MTRILAIDKPCSIAGCQRPHDSHGYCGMHYMRVKRHGSAGGVAPDVFQGSDAERLWSYVTKSDGCWTWTGSIRADGYGVISINDRMVRAHRLTYETMVGPIPEGLTLDHLCRNRACVRPDHLEPVTRSENLRRGDIRWRTRETHCKNGHPFDEANTLLWRGYRLCRACRARTRREVAARKAAVA